ncbi:MAG: 2TM domain-containing protein [Polaribacter sp.]
MEANFLQEQQYIKARKRVKDIKGFYVHLMVYVLVNLFISGVIIFGLTRDEEDSITEAISNFGVYSTWIFWGIGILFHWLGVFGFKSIGFSRDWEERKIKELMEKDRLNNR